MKIFRREFIKTTTGFAGYLLANWFTPFKVVAALSQESARLKIINHLLNAEGIIRSRTGQGIVRIDINEFASLNNFGVFTNSQKRKTVIYIGQDRATFTAENGFVILNDQLLHFLPEPVWENGELWVPVQVLADVFSKNTFHQMEFNPASWTFTIGQKKDSNANLIIAGMENGTLIRVFTDRPYTDTEITHKISNDWFYLEVLGGKFDAAALESVPCKGIVSDIKVTKFPTIISIGFKLNKKVISRDVHLENDGREILVNLRTSDKIVAGDETKKDLEEQKKKWLIETIVVDAGHGGKDPGAIGYDGLQEKDVVLPIALKLGDMIKERMPGVKVVYTRNTDTFIPLWQRTKLANEANGKLFISLHCNSNSNKSARGFETYFLSADKDVKAKDVVLKENEAIQFEESSDKERYKGVNFVLATMAQNAFMRQSQYLASSVQEAMRKRLQLLDMQSRGVKQGPFWVMVGATMPNILIELGFISNKYESKTLRQKASQIKIAEAIYAGIEKYKMDIESAI